MLATLVIAGIGLLIAVIIVVVLIMALVKVPPAPQPQPPGPTPAPIVSDPSLTNTLISDFTLATQGTKVVVGRTPTEDIIFVGCPASGSGRVDVYSRNLTSNTINLVNIIYPPPGFVSNFGYSIAVTPGAEYLIVGAPTSGMAPQTGAAFVYQRVTGYNYSLVNTTNSVTPTVSVNSRYGNSVSIKFVSSSVIAIVGEPGAQDGDGMITVIRKLGSVWSTIKRFNSSDVGLSTGSLVEFTESGIVSSGVNTSWYFENYSQKYIYPEPYSVSDLVKVNEGIAMTGSGKVNIYNPLSLVYSDAFVADKVSATNSGLTLVATSSTSSRYYKSNVNWSLVGELPGGVDSFVTGGGTDPVYVYILTGPELLVYS